MRPPRSALVLSVLSALTLVACASARDASTDAGAGDPDAVLPDGARPDAAVPPGVVQVGAPSASTTEAGGLATFEVVLAIAPTADVRIAVSTLDAGEGSADPAELVFTPTTWSTPQTVTVTGADDDVDDGDQVYMIDLAAAASTDPAYTGLDPADATVTNVDDDAAGITVDAAGGTAAMTTEAGGQATFSVVLQSEPTADVAVNFASDDATEGTANVGTLTFTPATWNVPRVVTVTGVDDAVIDGDVTYHIDFSATTSVDPLYAAFVPASITLINQDDEAGLCAAPSCWGGDNFEDGNITGFTTHGQTVNVDATTGANGSARSLRVTGGSSSHQDGARRSWPGCQPDRFTVWVRPDASTGARNYVVLGAPSGASPITNNIVFLYALNGTWRAINDVTDTDLAPVVANVWMRVDIDFHWAARTYDVFFNGTLEASGLRFRDTGVSQLGQADFYNYASATGHWDQIELRCP